MYPEDEAPPLTKLMAKSLISGVVLFCLLGVWLLPGKGLILKYFRAYIAAGFFPSLIGAYFYEKSGSTKKMFGVFFIAIGFCFWGAFFALCIYLPFSK